MLLAVLGTSCKNSILPELVRVQFEEDADTLVAAVPGKQLELTAAQWKSGDPAWALVGDIVNYGWPALALTPTDGEGVVFVDASQPTYQRFPLEHGDLELTMEYMVSPGAEFGIYLQGNYRVDLNGEAGVGALYLGQLVNGEIPEIYDPALDVARSPGLWEQVKLVFQAPSFGENGEKILPAKLSELYLNGNLVQYQQDLYGPAPGAPNGTEMPVGPLSFFAEKGQVAIRNIRYRELEPVSSYVYEGEVAVLGLPRINYTYYELNNSVDAMPDLSKLAPGKSGKINRFDIKAIKQRSELYAIQFTADLNIPIAGEYTFFLSSDDGSNLYLDNELLIDNDGIHATEEKRGRKKLSAGDHRLRIDFFQGGGGDALTLAYRAPGGEKTYLNSIEPDQIVMGPAVQQMKLQTDEEPYLLRSFLFFPPGQTETKRTHAVSVGEGTGPHYSVDLATGSLLMAWSGEFLNTVDMWNDRGIPQVAAPLGGVVAFSSAPQWSNLNDPQKPWPDTLAAAANFQHERYELDAQGRPTFYYHFGEGAFSDRILPGEGRSLSRQIKFSSAGKDTYLMLARGQRIEDLAENIYRIDSDGGYVLELGDLSKVKLFLRDEGGTQALVARIRGDQAQINYQIYW